MIPASPHPAQPEDWRALYRDAAISATDLLAELGLGPLGDRMAGNDAGFPLRVPKPYRQRIRRGDPDDPLLRQVLPLAEEARVLPGFQLDAVGDLGSRGARGVLHKYQGRALLIATGSCAVHCRYCFRRHFPYADEPAAANRWREAVDYLRSDPTIHEVLLSGGDPWSLATPKLAELTAQLAQLPQLRRLRIHTRLPVVIPQRVDAELLRWLATLPWPTVVVLHINHPQEIDAAVIDACARLRGSGVTLLNQAVLLRGVNDSVPVQQALAETLFEAGVLPYYLHLLDRVQGAAHFEVGEAEARALHAELHARLPGYLLPRLVREIAGQPGKTAV